MTENQVFAACKAAGSHSDLEQIIWEKHLEVKTQPAGQKIPTQVDRSPCFSSEQVQWAESCLSFLDTERRTP